MCDPFDKRLLFFALMNANYLLVSIAVDIIIINSMATVTEFYILLKFILNFIFS